MVLFFEVTVKTIKKQIHQVGDFVLLTDLLSFCILKWLWNTVQVSCMLELLRDTKVGVQSRKGAVWWGINGYWAADHRETLLYIDSYSQPGAVLKHLGIPGAQGCIDAKHRIDAVDHYL